jgi:hypothetical protein
LGFVARFRKKNPDDNPMLGNAKFSAWKKPGMGGRRRRGTFWYFLALVSGKKRLSGHLRRCACDYL